MYDVCMNVCMDTEPHACRMHVPVHPRVNGCMHIQVHVHEHACLHARTHMQSNSKHACPPACIQGHTERRGDAK